MTDFSDLTRMPDFRIPDIKIPPNPLIVAAQANLASEFHKRLTEWISNFDTALDQEHEVGVRLVTFGQTVVFHLKSIAYWNPSLISFSGTLEDGSPVELIQHVSQISVLLMKLPRKDPSAPKRPIGFASENEGDGQ
ncbi:MAG: DUF6173 family protein [Terriglobales bacterium]